MIYTATKEFKIYPIISKNVDTIKLEDSIRGLGKSKHEGSFIRPKQVFEVEFRNGRYYFYGSKPRNAYLLHLKRETSHEYVYCCLGYLDEEEGYDILEECRNGLPSNC